MVDYRGDGGAIVDEVDHALERQRADGHEDRPLDLLTGAAPRRRQEVRPVRCDLTRPSRRERRPVDEVGFNRGMHRRPKLRGGSRGRGDPRDLIDPPLARARGERLDLGVADVGDHFRTVASSRTTPSPPSIVSIDGEKPTLTRSSLDSSGSSNRASTGAGVLCASASWPLSSCTLASR